MPRPKPINKAACFKWTSLPTDDTVPSATHLHAPLSRKHYCFSSGFYWCIETVRLKLSPYCFCQAHLESITGLARDRKEGNSGVWLFCSLHTLHVQTRSPGNSVVYWHTTNSERSASKWAVNSLGSLERF